MIKFQCLGTGSKGNCYLLKTEKETLILDCGVQFKKIKQGLNYDISNVSGAIVSHWHMDHFKSLKDLENVGLRAFTPNKDERIGKFLGKFYIDRFELPHDETENYGFYIKVGGETILYLTDFEYCKYRFDNLKPNHILVECNYQEELVNRDLPNFKHKIAGHCSLETCKNFAKTNATDALKTVILLHMDDLCDPDKCVDEVKKVVPFGVYVDYARNGLNIDFKGNECPF